jgi:hypothetical protein
MDKGIHLGCLFFLYTHYRGEWNVRQLVVCETDDRPVCLLALCFERNLIFAQQRGKNFN